MLAWFADPEVAERIGQAGSPTRRGEGHVAAAVRCRVGRGAAVVSGTHPELAPAWLEGSKIDPGVLRKLKEGDEGRKRFFDLLLGAAGV